MTAVTVSRSDRPQTDGRIESAIGQLFADHPPIEKRVDRLQRALEPADSGQSQYPNNSRGREQQQRRQQTDQQSRGPST